MLIISSSKLLLLRVSKSSVIKLPNHGIICTWQEELGDEATVFP